MKKTNRLLFSGLLILLILLPYLQMHSHEFINWDDPDYIYNNPMVSAGLSWFGTGWAFITGTAANWHPVTWMSHMVDSTLFGPTPEASHLINLFWYIGCVLLVFFLSLRLGASPAASFFMAAFFGAHPLRVESVAWAAERKDILCAFFFLSATLTYLRYAVQKSRVLYVLTSAFFCLSLLSKPMAVTWPVVALMMDYWPLQRFHQKFKEAIYEKIPWFILTILSSIVTVIVQKRGDAVKSFLDFPLTDRLANAVISYTVYMRQIVWPSELTVFYPYPPDISGISVAGACLILGIISFVVFRQRQKHPYLLWGWLFYLIVLFPVIGIVQVGAHAHADRYTLLPQLGIVLALGFLLDNVILREKIRRIAAMAFMTIIVILMMQTFRQVSYWKDSITLFHQNLSVTGPNDLAHFNLGLAYLEKNDLDLAVMHFTASAQMNPNDVTSYNNLGIAYLRQNEISLAESCFRQAISVNPGAAQPYFYLAGIKLDQGLIQEAKELSGRAVQLAPGWDEVRNLFLRAETLSLNHSRKDE